MMDKVAEARAGLIRVVHEQGEDHRIPCSLCGMPCEPDKLTRVFEDQDLCPECTAVFNTSKQHQNSRRMRRRSEDQDYDAIRIV